jgi:hypothetical protein
VTYKHSLEFLHVSNTSLDLVNMPTLFGPEHCKVMCPSIFLCYILGETSQKGIQL